MISLKFSITELKEFHRFLVAVLKELQTLITSDDVHPVEKLRVKAELGELNKCYSFVDKKIRDTFLFSKIRKSYTVKISYMQGWLILMNNDKFDLGPLTSAILNEKVTFIHKTLI